MIEYERIPIQETEKLRKKKVLIKLLNTGIDEETKKKRDAFMMDARKKYSKDAFEEEQVLYVE